MPVMLCSKRKSEIVVQCQQQLNVPPTFLSSGENPCISSLIGMPIALTVRGVPRSEKMIIQGFSNIASVYGATSKLAIERQTSPAPAANYAEKVTLSTQGKALAAGDTKSSAGPNLAYQELLIKNVKEYPSWGEKFTKDFAYDKGFQTTGPLVDISNLPTISYTYTGELVTDSNLSAFKAEAATARTGRVALYEAEKAKGTSDAAILEKLFRYTDTQSDSYLSKIGWERAKSTDAAAGATQTITPAQQHLLNAAKSDRASAEKISYDLASTPSSILYDISGQPGVGDGPATVPMGTMKLSTTGEIVDEAYVKKFNETASGIDAQRLAIYEAESKKGTDPVEIISKMIDFTNQQSQDYLDATGWGWRGSTPPA